MSQLENIDIAFDWLESHAPFPCPTAKTIYILLKFHSVLCIFDFVIIQSSANSLNSESMSVAISLIYNENNNGPRTVP